MKGSNDDGMAWLVIYTLLFSLLSLLHILPAAVLAVDLWELGLDDVGWCLGVFVFSFLLSFNAVEFLFF